MKKQLNIGDLYTVKTIAKQEGISVQSVYKKIRKNKYNIVKIDGVLFIKK